MPTARHAALAGLALAAGVGAVNAADNVPATNSLFVSALAGAQDFSAKRGALDDAANGTVALGFRFTDRLSIELAGGRTDTSDGAGHDIKVDGRRIDALWHFTPAHGWQPYAAAGVGEQDFDAAAGRARETVLEAGGGLFHRIAGPLQFRADLRVLYSLDERAIDAIAGAGLVLGFGGPVEGFTTPDSEDASP